MFWRGITFWWKFHRNTLIYDLQQEIRKYGKTSKNGRLQYVLCYIFWGLMLIYIHCFACYSTLLLALCYSFCASISALLCVCAVFYKSVCYRSFAIKMMILQIPVHQQAKGRKVKIKKKPRNQIRKMTREK